MDGGGGARGSGPLTHFLSQSAAAAAAARSTAAAEFFLQHPSHRSLMSQHHHQQRLAAGVAAAGGGGGGGGSTYVSIGDKRNRNPNWTDGEIIRFLEILQEESVMRDLLAQRNKQVFCYVAQRLGAEGADKTWDQCRIKLKNLKSQYRYVKERIPEVATINLENEDSMKHLVSECQSRGISPSSLKHLKYLRRFLAKVNQVRLRQPLELPQASSSSLAAAADPLSMGSSSFSEVVPENVEVSVDVAPHPKDEDGEESVSPPPSSTKSKELIIVDDDDLRKKGYLDVVNGPEPVAKRPRLSGGSGGGGGGGGGGLDNGNWTEVHGLIERLNQEMTERFLDHQRRSQASLHHWELERQRQHEQAMERWRQEAREHERHMFGLFARMVGECNAAIAAVAKVASRHSACVSTAAAGAAAGAGAGTSGQRTSSSSSTEAEPRKRDEEARTAEQNGLKEEQEEEEDEEEEEGTQEDDASLL